jgi:hypothetical protein
VEVLLVVVLRGRVAAALLGEHVHHDGAFGRQLDGVAQRVLECLDVVAVDRADVAHAERLEERRRLQELAHRSLERLDALLRLRADVRQIAQELFELALAAHVHRVEADVGEAVRQLAGDALGQAGVVGDGLLAGRDAGGEVADGGRVAATVVVEHDDDALVAVADVVQRLVRHAAGHAAVADDGDDVAVRVGAGIAGDGQAVRVREHRARMAVLDVVVRAFLAVRVARHATRLAERSNCA